MTFWGRDSVFTSVPDVTCTATFPQPVDVMAAGHSSMCAVQDVTLRLGGCLPEKGGYMFFVSGFHACTVHAPCCMGNQSQKIKDKTNFGEYWELQIKL